MTNTLLRRMTEEFRRAVSKNFWLRAATMDDRTLVITTTSMLDEFIALAIVAKCRFLMDDKLYQAVFKGDGPLSKFSYKIIVGRLLGILVGNVSHDLAILKKIRNDFAHDFTFLDLHERSTSNRCRSLKLTADLSQDIMELAGTAERKALLQSAASISLHLAVMVHFNIAEMRLISKYREELNAQATASLEQMKKGLVPGDDAIPVPTTELIAKD